MKLYSNRFKSGIQKIKLILLVIGLTTLLTGCDDLNSKFTCPLQPGVNCQSLDQVNALVDQGKLGQAHSVAPSASANSPVKIAEPTPWAWMDVSSVYDIKNPPQRAPETVMRVWIAPYVDEQGNYYSDTVVYHVIQPRHWSGEQSTLNSTRKEESHV